MGKKFGKPVEAPIVQKRFWDLYEDGITFSLITKFFVCPHRFWLRVVKRLQPDEGFNSPIEFGSLMHAGYEADHLGVKAAQDAIQKYGDKLRKQYPSNITGIKGVAYWVHLATELYPIYVAFWKKHQKEKIKRLKAEMAFKVPIVLRDGRTIPYRGKFDAVSLIGDQDGGRARFFCLEENKNKGEVDEDGLSEALLYDCQTGNYCIALDQLAETNEWKKYRPVSNVLYNVVLRPGGQKYSIRVKKGETDLQFANRLIDGYRKTPERFFKRWNVGLDEKDLENYKRKSMLPMLTIIANWWDSVKDLSDPFDSPLHWMRPFGMYDAMFDGLRGDFQGYLLRGSRIGVKRCENLFPELS